MHQLTDRQLEIKTRLDKGFQAREIAEDLGITRNAVYQQIQRMRRQGNLDHDFTPTGQPRREGTSGSALLNAIARNSNGETDAETAGALALVLELRRTRDELAVITRRLSTIVGA
jgi:transposase